MLTEEKNRLVKIMKDNKRNWHEILDSTELENVIRIFSDLFQESVSVADPKTSRIVQKTMINFEHSPQEIYDRVIASEKYRKVLKGK